MVKFYCLLLPALFIWAVCPKVNNIYESPKFTVTANSVTQGAFKAVAASATAMHSNYISSYKSPADGGAHRQAEENRTRQTWTLTRDISGYPRYESDQVLCDALYNLSLEELLQDVRSDGALMAGAKWPGVWTRDIGYSILLSLAIIEPDAARKSLLAKVKNDRIVQDTGTGGSWPVSTDRMVWALAAYEIYAVSGDADWLKTAFDIIRNSAEDDLETAFNPETGLMYGESSFLDWREQTYPRWMDPKDIFRSQNLGTNAVHFQTYVILAQMAEELKQPEPAKKYSAAAADLKKAINANLWIEKSGTYGQYLYGRAFQSLSPRSETLGAALTVLFDIASDARQARIVASLPTTKFGATCIFPQIPDVPPYHNYGIWPFVEAFRAWSGAKTGNTASVEHSLAAIYRPAALFLTNKENMVAKSGDFMGTEINSDRQLWSVAGNLATVYRVFFGMQFKPDKLVMKPFIPQSYGGKRSLKNFRYRQSILDISTEGFGDKIESVTMDGQAVQTASVKSDLSGRHKIFIRMNNRISKPGLINLVKVKTAPDTPVLTMTDSLMTWNYVPDANRYIVYKNGKVLVNTIGTAYKIPRSDRYAEYQVMAVAKDGTASFLSQPLCVVDKRDTIIIEAEGPDISNKIPGFYGSGYIPLTRQVNTAVPFRVYLPKGGRFAVDFRYSNGNGPIGTDNKCAIRSLLLDEKKIGAVVLPQRGEKKWSDWGYSNAILVDIPAGDHTFTLKFTPSDENMNGEINTALLDRMRLIRVNP
ncbi:MAG: glycogen debranching protein [bacterium]